MILERRSLNTSLNLQSNTLWKWISISKSIWIRLILRANKVATRMYLMEDPLTDNILFVTDVLRRSISNITEGPRELVIVVTHPISQLTRSQNGSPRSLLSQIPHIWQHTPWPKTAINTGGLIIEIMVMVHGYFTGRVSTMSGKISKAMKILLDFLILLWIQSSIATT